MNKLSEFIKDFTETEDVELPDKWYIIIDELNKDILNNYLHKNQNKYQDYHKNWSTDITTIDFHYFASEQINQGSHSLLLNNKSKQKLEKNGFIQITNDELFLCQNFQNS